MKRIARAGFFLLPFLASACGYLAPVVPPGGLLFSNIQAPIDTDMESTVVKKKMGASQSVAVLGLFAFGDASIAKAAEEGGLTTVHHVDYEYMNILFFYQSFKTKAYGD